MSLETNINFKCVKCGCVVLARLTSNVTVREPVREMTSFDGVTAPLTSGFSNNGGHFVGYGCCDCENIVATTPHDLLGYLTTNGMICEYRNI